MALIASIASRSSRALTESVLHFIIMIMLTSNTTLQHLWTTSNFSLLQPILCGAHSCFNCCNPLYSSSILCHCCGTSNSLACSTRKNFHRASRIASLHEEMLTFQNRQGATSIGRASRCQPKSQSPSGLTIIRACSPCSWGGPLSSSQPERSGCCSKDPSDPAVPYEFKIKSYHLHGLVQSLVPLPWTFSALPRFFHFILLGIWDMVLRIIKEVRRGQHAVPQNIVAPWFCTHCRDEVSSYRTLNYSFDDSISSTVFLIATIISEVSCDI